MNNIPKSVPLVSVAMITYNHERFITEAIESVLAQRTKFPIELIVGDDASTDDTGQHIEVFRARAPEMIRTLIRPTNIGSHRNFKGVLEECRGEFVAFLEGDDYWTSEEKLQIQVDILRTHRNAIGVFHPANDVDTTGREITKVYPDTVMREIGTRDLLKARTIPTPSIVVRRNVLVRLPDSYRKLKMSDWPICVFASLHGPWLCFPKVMAAHRIHDGGVWSSLSEAARRDSIIELFNFFATELPQPFSALARQQLAQLHLEALEEALVGDRPADARRVLREIIRLLSDYRMSEDGRRLIKGFWRTLSPRTYRLAKQTLRMARPTWLRP